MTKVPYTYIPVPKTASRSIRKALGEEFDVGHKTAAELADQATISKFKFASVRNPWDRAVSWWIFFVHKGDPWNIPAFVDWVTKRTSYPGSPPFPFEQSRYYLGPAGELLVDDFIRFENLEADFARVAERLGIPAALDREGAEDKREVADNFDKMTRDYGTPKADLEPLIADYRLAYSTQESIDSIARIESDVISRFGYQFRKA